MRNAKVATPHSALHASNRHFGFLSNRLGDHIAKDKPCNHARLDDRLDCEEVHILCRSLLHCQQNAMDGHGGGVGKREGNRAGIKPVVLAEEENKDHDEVVQQTLREGIISADGIEASCIVGCDIRIGRNEGEVHSAGGYQARWIELEACSFLSSNTERVEETFAPCKVRA